MATPDAVTYVGLTSELEDQDSRVRLFFAERFPNRRAIKRDVRDRTVDAPTIRPTVDVAWGTIGTALDYRLRFSFEAARALIGDLVGGGLGLLTDESYPPSIDPEPPLLARIGALILAGSGLITKELAAEFFGGVAAAVRDARPFSRRLTLVEEDRLCRFCYVLGLFDEVARLGGVYPTSPLATLPDRATIDDLLRLPSDVATEDLRRLSWLFMDTQQHLLAGTATLNPTFEGSMDIGGADGDVIVDHCIIDFKTAVDPKSIKKPSWPWQLLGYALLDYNDSLGLKSVGLYLARQGVSIQWPLDEFAAKLAGQEVSLEAARASLRHLLRAGAP